MHDVKFTSFWPNGTQSIQIQQKDLDLPPDQISLFVTDMERLFGIKLY